MEVVTLQDVTIDFHPPTEPLEILKAILDITTFVAFIILLVIIVYAAREYPIIERKRTFWPLVVFAIFGMISTAMDAFDEWYWFSPGEFYNFIWKPIRLTLLLVGIFILVIAFSQFYDFSKRLFGEDIDG